MLKKKTSKLGKRSDEAFKGTICQIQLGVFVIKKNVKVRNIPVLVRSVKKTQKKNSERFRASGVY